MKILVYSLAVVLSVLVCSSFGQKMEFMQDMPEGDGKVTSRKVMIVVKDTSISSVAIIDRDGDASFVEAVSNGNRNLMVEIPVGKTYIISSFQTGVKAAQEKKLISVSETGAVTFGVASRTNTDVAANNTTPTGAKPGPKPTQPTSPIKLTIDEPTYNTKDSTAKIKVKMDPVPTTAGHYVVSVTQDGLTETAEVPFDIKDAGISAEKELEISVKKGKSIVKIFPRIGDTYFRDNVAQKDFDCVGCSRQTITKEPYRLSKYLQAYFGTEIVGASAASSQAQPFLNLKLWLPMRYRKSCENIEFNFKCLAFWADFRFASSASQQLPDLTSISGPTAAGFFSSNQSSSINQLVRSFQTKIGLEYGIGKYTSFIVGGGITSPLSASQSVQAYKIPVGSDGSVIAPFRAIFGDINYTGLNTLILKSGERDRFQRNWFAGGRVRYRMFDDDLNVAPAELDLTFGQDEALTKKLSGMVMRFDSTVPIKLGDRQVLYFGAGYSLRLTRKVNFTSVPFFLEPTASYNLYGNTNLVRDFDETPFGTSTRDTFSFRVGVDILRLIFGNKDEEAATGAAKTDDNTNLTNQKKNQGQLVGGQTGVTDRRP